MNLYRLPKLINVMSSSAVFRIFFVSNIIGHFMFFLIASKSNSLNWSWSAKININEESLIASSNERYSGLSKFGSWIATSYHAAFNP